MGFAMRWKALLTRRVGVNTDREGEGECEFEEESVDERSKRDVDEKRNDNDHQRTLFPGQSTP